MSTINRGIRLYLASLSFGSLVVLAWATNRYLLGNATAETGWPVLVGVAAAVLVVGTGLYRLYPTPAPSPLSESYPWSSRERDRRE